VIGNDIVDLQLAAVESNWQRRSYLDKIFTAEERSMIYDAVDPTVMVWLLWSRKEAVYKIIHRETRIRTYAPLKFINNENNVSYEGTLYPVKSYHTDSCIHTIAVERSSLFDSLEVHTTRYNITKDEYGIPFFNGNPVSISHHGRYTAMITMPATHSYCKTPSHLHSPVLLH
jgi:phosphopantetheinyl transferase (holo-ACP synthase)